MSAEKNWQFELEEYIKQGDLPSQADSSAITYCLYLFFKYAGIMAVLRQHLCRLGTAEREFCCLFLPIGKLLLLGRK